GGGPAGLGAALSAATMGAQVVLFDRQHNLGGQLVKQTHKFFGSKAQFAGERGI
ncbi:MAG TPA: pyridine nucleotide-disulfide oxidoreductase, partial [Firmicutes bacterium]|nr:pyridine nucleotide-disulfide oxidoreductase [Bacillota bacterium]